jgi:hypothetical protein
VERASEVRGEVRYLLRARQMRIAFLNFLLIFLMALVVFLRNRRIAA